MQGLPATLMMPPRVLTGAGQVRELLPGCAAFGARGVFVHGASLTAAGTLAGLLASAPASVSVLPWQHPGGEPTLDQLEDLLTIARAHGATWLAAVGGGSVMDIAKAAAGLLEAPLPPAQYHDGAAIPPTRVAFAAAPTTAGTGSEATTVSVLTDATRGLKRSIRHPSFMPRLVILDPDLLTGCPQAVMAASGMDALVQAIESFFSRGATAFSDALALEGIRLMARGLGAVAAGAPPAEDRRTLLEGSFLAGVALSHARLGLVHGLAHPLGIRYHAAHGLVCAICMPPVLAFNRETCPAKYETVSRILGGDALARFTQLLERLQLASPFTGRPLKDREAIVRETLESGSTAANPRPVTDRDVEAMLETLFA